ncbi:MAG: alpha-L-fucosidase, partial [Bacteroidaceae bacterium]|nr:alpha-L-fucosidase [Bacteroidaceae bacterium]
MRRAVRTLVFLFPFIASAQSYIHEQSTDYVWPDDPAVVSHLKEWQDLKFGIILHWGVYSVPGICESWTITSEDWITPDTTRSYEEYKQWYWSLSSQFNPTRFDPAQWARVAREAGMKYVVFTTKHHDGFCLFDSKETDYTVTHSGFAGDPRADVARYVFDAFRAEGMMTGCYFSKPDWHSP